MFETKIHYKSYKAGKQWLFTAIGVTTLCAGLTMAVPAKAATSTTGEGAPTTNVVPVAASSESTNVANNGSATDDPVPQAVSTEDNSLKTSGDAVNDADTTPDNQGSEDSSTDTDTDTTPTLGDGVTVDPATQKQYGNETAPSHPVTGKAVTDDAANYVIPAPTPSKTTGTTVAPNAPVDPVQAITNHPDGTFKDQRQGSYVVASGYLTAKNDQGTSTSLSTDNNIQQGVSSIVDPNATDLTFHLHVHVTSSLPYASTYSQVTLSLPKDYKYYTPTTDVTLPADYTVTDVSTQLPDGFTVYYYVDKMPYQSAPFTSALAKGTLSWADVTRIVFSGTMTANQSYDLALPLATTEMDQYTDNGFVELGVLANDGFAGIGGGNLRFRFADQRDNVTSYQAVTQDPTTGELTAADAAVQAAMPAVGPDQLAYHNDYTDFSNPYVSYEQVNSDPVLFNGGSVIASWKNIINQDGESLADILAKMGYSLKLDANGQPIQSYTYNSLGQGETQDSAYVIVRQVLDTKDSSLTVGDDWTAADNFVSGLDDADNPLQASDVTVSIAGDPGVIVNGKAAKAGDAVVTYSYKVADDYNDTGKAYIVQKTATVHVTPATTPTKPDDGEETGTGTTTPTKPDDGDGTGTGTTTPTKPDDGDGTGTGTTTPTKPDDGGGTGTGTTTPTKPDDGDGTSTGTTTPTKPDDGDGTGMGTTTPTTPGDGTDTTVTTPTSPVITDGSGDTGTTDITAPTTTTTPNLVTDAAADTVTPEQGTLMTGGDGDKVVKTTTAKTTSVPGTVKAGAQVTTQQTAATLTTAKVTTQRTATLTTTPTTPSVKSLATSTKLPQTGEQATTSTLAVGLGLILGALGLGGLSRRKQD
ncbi:MAG TPA: KxYKxGKxW signal peptide domain-containing protein [Candidatus Levilactobacillus faecigallinarum]|uniref:KxYKxGKxW signal peptide domain-containing protein n=1 Tax=Candidatus Levilactobacillus faecigallinarum TaxID=2838638 RepID=A0A9D1QS28_9LACO|nr:KxYKxGKxW signal peptide domain-containing protein [Candidatus Levilactobacillus faecigallinarum]